MSLYLISLTSLCSFAVAALASAHSLLLAPLLFGVPHLVSELWILLYQDTGRSRRIRITWCALSVAYIGYIALLTLGALDAERFGRVDTWILVGFLVTPFLLSRRLVPRPVLSYVIIAASIIALLFYPTAIRGIVAHLHNLVAVVFLAASAAPQGRKTIWLVTIGPALLGGALAAVSGTVLLVPVFDPVLGPFLSLTFNLGQSASAFLLFTFAFLQLIHFATWIGFLPRIFRFTRSYRSLAVVSLGWIAVVTGLAIWGTTRSSLTGDIARLRNLYLSLVSFHGWMEFAWLLSRNSDETAAPDHLDRLRYFTLRKAPHV